MELFEIEDERRLGREEAAAWLREVADALAKHNSLEFLQNGRKVTVSVPKEIDMEVELEMETDGTKIEIELSW